MECGNLTYLESHMPRLYAMDSYDGQPTFYPCNIFFACCSEFTRAFQHAVDRIQARATFDHFDGSGEADLLHGGQGCNVKHYF